jgi:hypothetical protein
MGRVLCCGASNTITSFAVNVDHRGIIYCSKLVCFVKKICSKFKIVSQWNEGLS